MPTPIPSATYRLQLTPSFGFDQARRIVPYLDALGADTLYLSPVVAARRHSPHGYDGIDPGRLDPERGGSAGFRRLRRALDRRGMGLLVDIVPNHLATALENPAWRDVLRRGPRSRFAPLFDIDWTRTPEGRPALVLPWLDRSVPKAFSEGELAFEWGRAGLALRSTNRRLPVSTTATRRVRGWIGGAGAGVRGGKPASLATRARVVLDRVNRGATGPDRARREALLGDLAYRLVPWWEFTAINYRRFFDISDLVGVRSDEPQGFGYMHRWLVRAVRSGAISGVRVDHVDGLADPVGYLDRLARALREAAPAGHRPWVVVEKILAADETVPEGWPVEGTTGYEALRQITGVLIPLDAPVHLDLAYRRACPGAVRRFPDEAFRSKLAVAETLFPGERAELVRRLGAAQPGIAPRTARASLDRALTAVTAALSVYRTYDRAGGSRPKDRERVRAAFDGARRRGPGARAGIRDLARRWPAEASARSDRSGFLRRWQQWTAAVAAKGVEDTAFYRHARFLGTNEVGCDPDRPAVPLEEFHRFMRARARRSPRGLTPTSTHDTKWGEDARARLVALTEWADAWGESARRWRIGNRRFAARLGGERVPGPAEEYRLYQTLIASAPSDGSLPSPYGRRLEAHCIKTAREAKRRTGWIRPNAAYETALVEFVRSLRTDPEAAGFRDELATWVRRIAFFGAYYSLAQVVLRITLPGVPDLYQGSEGWNLSLVDPDNRRPVRYGRLQHLLARAHSVSRGLLGSRRSPGVPRELDKIALTAGLLSFRREHRTFFDRAAYVPLAEAPSPGPTPTLAFARARGSEWLIVAIGRGLAEVSGRSEVPPVSARWGNRTLPLPARSPRAWQEVLTGRPVRASGSRARPAFALAELFDRWPLAVLSSKEGRNARLGTSSGRSRGKALANEGDPVAITWDGPPGT